MWHNRIGPLLRQMDGWTQTPYCSPTSPAVVSISSTMDDEGLPGLPEDADDPPGGHYYTPTYLASASSECVDNDANNEHMTDLDHIVEGNTLLDSGAA